MKPIAVDEFFGFRFLSNITFSPEGGTACLTVTEINKKKDEYRSFLTLYRDKKFVRLTSFGKERSFQYLDEDTILFPGKRDAEKGEEGDISSSWYTISLSGGEAQEAFRFPIPVSKVMPLENGDLLVLGMTFPGFEDLYKGDPKLLAAYRKHMKDNKDYEIIEQNPWWWNGATFTKGAYTSLFRYDKKKKALTRLTALNENVGQAELSKDKKYVFFMAYPVKPFLKLHGTGEIRRLDLETGKAKSIVKSTKDLELHGFAAGETFLLVLAAEPVYGLNTDGDFYKWDYKTGKFGLYAKHGESLHSSVGTDVRYGGGRGLKMDGDVCWFISTRFDSAGLFKLEHGEITQVFDKPGSVDSFDICGGKLLMIGLFDMKPLELYDGKGRRLSRFNEAALRGKYVAQPEILNVKRKGYDVHGFVLKPMDYDPEKKYPVILDIHGGPKTVYGPVFYHEMQYWAGRGYFVIFCNPTGSDGRGAFMDIRGKYGTVDYEDIMAFTDAALKAYPAMDKKNLFETGGSYGGFMTNWIIGHTNRFKAVASQRSISNWFSMLGVSDIGVGFTEDQNLSSPWDDPEKLWFHSPMKYADKVKTPTLFIHSFEDYRCPIDQGYQMFTSLIAHGVEAKMVCFRGENHELSRSGKPSHRLKRLNEITEWFEKHRG
ncbi:MAG: S9 family peptidase [Clostridia bacterium]|nr:S9 family peptidase [Clostridia bacterium]